MIILLAVLIPLLVIPLLLMLSLMVDLAGMGFNDPGHPETSSTLDSGDLTMIGVLVAPIVLIIAIPLGLLWWIARRNRTTRTIVTRQGLSLRTPGAPERLIPWEQAHGRITVKAVTQYVPNPLVGSATMCFVCVAFDDTEIPLPGTMLNSSNEYAVIQRNHAVAMRILARDPWHQEEPLMAIDRAYTPYVPASGVHRVHHPMVSPGLF